MVLNSGRGRHPYWSLWEPGRPNRAEAANRLLAHALGADARATDASRVLRPPQTGNFKEDAPRPVELEELTLAVALTEEQVEGIGLIKQPLTAAKYPTWPHDRTVEVEALAPDVLARILLDAVDGLTDADTRHAVIEREAEERAQLLREMKEGER